MPCPKGCRTKPHGNKGKKATPAQAAALRRGREKMARNLMAGRPVPKLKSD